jgi:pimeloyl-ACP methyl ester carboxylesterase
VRVEIEPGVRLYFDIEGVGLEPDGPSMREKPTLLLLHGGPGFDHSLFKPWFGRFADTHQVVYLDHRGQGRSDQRDDSTHWLLDTWADDVARFCDALELVQPVILGNSFGGMVAIRTAARHPGLASKLVLSSTAARMLLDDVLAMFQKLGGDEVREIARRFWTDPASATDDYLVNCLPLYTRHSGNLTDGAARARMNLRVGDHFIVGEQQTMDLRGDLATIGVPTLVLAGELDPVCPPSAQAELVKALDPAVVQFELFEDCGHGTYRDQPERTETVLRGFLSS